MADNGTAFFLLGYIVWLIDDLACRHLIDARHAVGIPVAFILELHGWYVVALFSCALPLVANSIKGGMFSPLLEAISAWLWLI